MDVLCAVCVWTNVELGNIKRRRQKEIYIIESKCDEDILLDSVPYTLAGVSSSKPPKTRLLEKSKGIKGIY